MSLTYASYLKIEQLLALQEAQSEPAEHDEMLFIIIHQTYELWFKQLLHETTALRSACNEGNVWMAAHTLKRMLKIMKTLVGQIDILETMTPLSFKGFRYYLDTASGFQSVQFRELEIIMGFRSHLLDAVRKQSEWADQRIKDRLKEQPLWDAYLNLLQKNGISISKPPQNVEHGLTFAPSPEIQSKLVEIERSGGPLSMLNELLIDLDEGFSEWRYRHMKLVQRTIGHKHGTGGSAGVAYLQKTLDFHFFPDLWAIRSVL
jgi:tryptophan 2,3-dioxygenase